MNIPYNVPISIQQIINDKCRMLADFILCRFFQCESFLLRSAPRALVPPCLGVSQFVVGKSRVPEETVTPRPSAALGCASL